MIPFRMRTRLGKFPFSGSRIWGKRQPARPSTWRRCLGWSGVGYGLPRDTGTSIAGQANVAVKVLQCTEVLEYL